MFIVILAIIGVASTIVGIVFAALTYLNPSDIQLSGGSQDEESKKRLLNKLSPWLSQIRQFISHNPISKHKLFLARVCSLSSHD